MGIQVTLGPLARSGLESRPGGDFDASVRVALTYYVRKLRNGRPPARYPAFLPPAAADGSDAEDLVEVELDEKVEAEFVREAAAQKTTVARLAGHAVMLYLADVDLVDSRPWLAGR